MDHHQATQLTAVEKYLLDELPPELRDEFEEHYFDCQE
jgi:Putative zinc-finger